MKQPINIAAALLKFIVNFGLMEALIIIEVNLEFEMVFGVHLIPNIAAKSFNFKGLYFMFSFKPLVK